MVKNQKAQTWLKDIFDSTKNSEMASSEDKNAAGEVREEADGEVRVINTWCEIRIQYLKTISMFLDIYQQLNVISELKRDNGERKNAKG